MRKEVNDGGAREELAGATIAVPVAEAASGAESADTAMMACTNPTAAVGGGGGGGTSSSSDEDESMRDGVCVF